MKTETVSTARATRDAEILRDFDYAGIEVIGGVACAGETLWFADYTNKRLVQVDPSKGEVLRTLEGLDVGTGTAFDGRHLWQVGTGAVHEIDPGSGACVRSIPLEATEFVSGLSYAEGALWVGLCDSRRILKIDPATGEVLRTITTDRLVTGIAWLGEDLWHGAMDAVVGPGAEAEDQHTEVRRIDPESGEGLERLLFPPGTAVSGIAADGAGLLWCGDCRNGRLRAVRAPSSGRPAEPSEA